MVKRTLSTLRSLGYSTIELAIVLAVIGMISAIAFFGLGSFNQTQLVVNSQAELLATLRGVQNQVQSGVDGQSVKWVTIVNSTTYRIADSTTSEDFTLPSGVTFSSGTGSSVCFANNNLTAYTATYRCGSCQTGSGYICTGSTISAPASLTITLGNSTTSRSVSVQGVGMRVTRLELP